MTTLQILALVALVMVGLDVVRSGALTFTQGAIACLAVGLFVT